MESIGGYVYINSISDTKNYVKQGHFFDGIFWSMRDDFGTKRRNDFSQILAKAGLFNKKMAYEIFVSHYNSYICFLEPMDGIEPPTLSLQVRRSGHLSYIGFLFRGLNYNIIFYISQYLN